MSVSKYSNCSSSLTRNWFSRDMAVERTEAIASVPVLRAEPVNQRALCSGGSLLLRLGFLGQLLWIRLV